MTGRVPWGGDEREDDPDATEFIRELANAMPQDLGEGRLGALGWVNSFARATVAGVQVFNLTKTLPVEPYGQSGPALLTRNTTRRAWNATFEIMKGGIKRVAMLGVPGIGKSRNLALGLWHLVTGKLPSEIPQPAAIVFEARQSKTVFLFAKQGGEWKAKSLPWSKWAADDCKYLKVAKNWYLVDGFRCFEHADVVCQDSDRLQPRPEPLLLFRQRRRPVCLRRSFQVDRGGSMPSVVRDSG